jgi:tetratricopeptide (TPR) repeat protein
VQNKPACGIVKHSVDFDREHLERLLSDPEARAQIVDILEQAELGTQPISLFRRALPVLASLGAAAVTALAFLIPSLQEQWDRLKTQTVVDTYADIGSQLLREQSYAEAATVFAKAQELAESPRIDLEEGRLRASTGEVLSDLTWRGPNPSGLDESSFVVLERLERDHADARTRAQTLSHHGLFLISAGRDHAAEQLFLAAIALDPKSVEARVNLANVLSDDEQAREAETQYRRAIALDPEDTDARFNLGLLLEDADRVPEAVAELGRSVELASDDRDALLALARVLDRSGQSAAAAETRRRAKRLAAAGTPTPTAAVGDRG